MGSEAHLWAMLSAPLIGVFACCAALRDAGVGAQLARGQICTIALSLILVSAGAFVADGLTASLAAIVFLSGLSYFALFDQRTMTIPVWPALALAGLGLAATGLVHGGAALVQHVLAALFVVGAFLGLEHLYQKFRGRSGLGAGDALIAAALAAWLGPIALAWSVALGCLLTLIWVLARGKGRFDAFPLAPGLALGAALVFVGGQLAEKGDWGSLL